MFDENFYPAYFEDNDFYYRITSLYPNRYLGKIPEFTPYICRNSMTLALEPRLNIRFKLNEEYYVQKWGGAPGKETIPAAADNTPAVLYPMRSERCLIQGLHDLCEFISDTLGQPTAELGICEIGSYSGESTRALRATLQNSCSHRSLAG